MRVNKLFGARAKSKRSSDKGQTGNALAAEGDEGRGELRKASGSRSQALIRRNPNGGTPLGECPVSLF